MPWYIYLIIFSAYGFATWLGLKYKNKINYFKEKYQKLFLVIIGVGVLLLFLILFYLFGLII